MKGYSYNKKAALNPRDKREFHRKAAIAYITAAECYPEDDEQHPCMNFPSGCLPDSN
jgi:hypothetical protein